MFHSFLFLPTAPTKHDVWQLRFTGASFHRRGYPEIINVTAAPRSSTYLQSEAKGLLTRSEHYCWFPAAGPHAHSASYLHVSRRIISGSTCLSCLYGNRKDDKHVGISFSSGTWVLEWRNVVKQYNSKGCKTTEERCRACRVLVVNSQPPLPPVSASLHWSSIYKRHSTVPWLSICRPSVRSLAGSTPLTYFMLICDLSRIHVAQILIIIIKTPWWRYTDVTYFGYFYSSCYGKILYMMMRLYIVSAVNDL
jgi:hypothetical protein